LQGLGEQTITHAIEILKNKTTDSPCMIKARNDEPVFVLLARDSLAVGLVREWAAKLRTVVANSVGLSLEAQKKAANKVGDALLCASEMESFHTRQPPL
jgi:hypothetical protein